MAEKNEFQQFFAFYEQIRYFYTQNKGKIRRNYKDLTRKFLDYNDKEANPNAYLRKPQFEALEIYVFIKEFMNNQQVYLMFKDWKDKKNNFSDASYYSVRRNGQVGLFDEITEKQTETIFKQMKSFSEKYPNYIYALTMGLGKTILMATCIFYEFLLANKYPKDTRFCHNALVFAPEKTVLQSLKEIITFDKTLVVPKEYAKVLDTNLKIHFLEETGTTLNTLDDSDFNIIISNTQKIIVKKKHKEESATNKLFSMPTVTDDLLSTLYGDEGLETDNDLMFNQRFMKLCRLSQLGIYVDEAHHLFGTELEKELRSKNESSLRTTINLLADELSKKGTSVVACYNYTGTPYVKKQVLPEVVYSYGLRESIQNNYLKEVEPKGYENVKNEEFLRAAITQFWEKYGENRYEGLLPKIAIYGVTHDEIKTTIKPTVEKILAELGVPLSKILINVGDSSLTKNNDIKNFRDLDKVGTEGSEKQFIILCDKGKEGWNCRSLFAVALFRNPASSPVFVLQTTMRCMRKITDEQLTASVFLSKETLDILEDELDKNFNMQIKDLKNSSNKDKKTYQVRVLPPPVTIDNIKSIKHIYNIKEKTYTNPIDFKIAEIDMSKYQAIEYSKSGLSNSLTMKEKNVDKYKIQIKYSSYQLIAELARYLNISCILIEKILKESKDGIDAIVEAVNKYNEILDDVVLPKIFYSLYEVEKQVLSENKKMVLLKEPTDSAYYEFTADPNLVITVDDEEIQDNVEKSFHADTYCFDSIPERECFLQYLRCHNVNKVYFTGMFTAGQGDFSIQYIDPESYRIRNYYPDFLAEMNDGTYQIIEVKADNQIDNIVVKAKANAAKEIATESSMEYIMLPASFITKNDIFEVENPMKHLYEEKEN